MHVKYLLCLFYLITILSKINIVFMGSLLLLFIILSPMYYHSQFTDEKLRPKRWRKALSKSVASWDSNLWGWLQSPELWLLTLLLVGPIEQTLKIHQILEKKKKKKIVLENSEHMLLVVSSGWAKERAEDHGLKSEEAEGRAGGPAPSVPNLRPSVHTPAPANFHALSWHLELRGDSLRPLPMGLLLNLHFPHTWL